MQTSSTIIQKRKTMKKEFRVAFKTLAMKARVFNIFRTEFYKKRLETYTDKQKIELFDRLFHQVRASHNELNAYKQKRQDKAYIQMLRDERNKK